MESEQIARHCTKAALDKQAEDPVILDLRELSSFTDFFVICTTTSEPQLRAVANAIRETLKDEHGVIPMSMEGSQQSQWIIIDYSGVTVHVFNEQVREFYALEELWNDAPRLDIEDAE